jgi:hypothetical protein
MAISAAESKNDPGALHAGSREAVNAAWHDEIAIRNAVEGRIWSHYPEATAEQSSGNRNFR